MRAFLTPQEIVMGVPGENVRPNRTEAAHGAYRQTTTLDSGFEEFFHREDGVGTTPSSHTRPLPGYYFEA